MGSSQFDTDRGPSTAQAHVRFSGGARSSRAYEFRFEVGDHLGNDLVVAERLSAGPFTEIYRVWSESRLCPLVCKVLRPGIDDAREHERSLSRERRVLERIRHPNVVRSFPRDASLESEHLLIEHLSGPSLLDVLAASPRRRIKPSVAVRIAIGVGSAIEAVHRSGHLYRDLKPANILMREDLPVLVDFGSAYRWAPGRRPNDRVGTDPYMAPEQCLREALSPQTDVFGLGALAYEMLTGEWPYEDRLMNVFDRSKLSNRFPQIAYAPGSLRRRIPGMGPEIEEIVHRSLARNPADRFRSVADFVTALNALAVR